MKRILAAVLTAAVAFTCITAPVQKANAANNGDTYDDGVREYVYRNGYFEGCYGEDKEHGYTKVMQYLAISEGSTERPDFDPSYIVWYDRNGEVVFKLKNTDEFGEYLEWETVVDKREGYENVYVDKYGGEYTYKDGYCQQYSGTDEESGYTIMHLYKVYGKLEDGTYGNTDKEPYNGCIMNFSVGEMWYDKDGSIVYHAMKTDDPYEGNEVLVDKRKVEAYIVCRTQEKETLRAVAGFSINVFCSTDEEGTGTTMQAEWSSSDNSIAVIDNDGKITGKKAGEVTITATIKQNGQEVTKKVKVVKNQYKETKDYGYCKTTKTAWYDAKGNLKCRMVCKSKAKPDKEYKTELCSTIEMGKKVLKKFRIDATNIKKNKTKTKAYTIKNVKFFDLTKVKNFRWETYTFGTNRF